MYTYITYIFEAASAYSVRRTKRITHLAAALDVGLFKAIWQLM